LEDDFEDPSEDESVGPPVPPIKGKSKVTVHDHPDKKEIPPEQ